MGWRIMLNNDGLPVNHLGMNTSNITRKAAFVLFEDMIDI